MNKKLLAAAIAGAFIAPAAMADTSNVTIGGMIGVEVGSYSSSSPDATTALPAASGLRQGYVNSSNGSELHFKGTEDLGNGLSAIWFLGQDLSMDGEVTHWGVRNANAGLESKQWGRVIVGRNDSLYKMSTGKLDMFANTVADYNSVMGTKGFSVITNAASVSYGVSNNGGNNADSFDSRLNNVVMYSTPNFNGFTGDLEYAMAADTGNINHDTNAQKGKIWGARATYENGPIFATLAHEEQKLAGATTAAKEKATKLGFGYNFGAFKVTAAWERIKDDRTVVTGATALASIAGGAANTTTQIDHKAWYLGGSYTMGKTVLKAAYAKVDDLEGINDSGAKQWTLGADYNLSKRTKVYALYTKLSNERNGAYSVGQGGLQQRTNTASSTAAAGNLLGGSDPSAIAIGMHHSF